MLFGDARYVVVLLLNSEVQIRVVEGGLIVFLTHGNDMLGGDFLTTGKAAC